MSRRIQNFVRLYRRAGLRTAVARLVRGTVAAIYARRVELVLLKRLDETIATPRPPAELAIRLITAADGELLRQFNARHRTPSKVIASARYLRNGYRGFLAFVDDEPIGYWWWVSNATDPALTHPCLERFELRLSDDEVFAFDYFIAHEYRARGAAVKFLSLIYAELASLGYRGVWGSVDADNVAARWVYTIHGNTVVRRHVGHELLALLLLQNRRLFIRNTKWNAPHSFDRRLLWSLRSRKDERAPSSAVAHGLSTDAV